jgi:hypothetical protein
MHDSQVHHRIEEASRSPYGRRRNGVTEILHDLEWGIVEMRERSLKFSLGLTSIGV